MSRTRRSAPRKRLARRTSLERLEPRNLLATLFVGRSGSFATIQAAVDNARANDVILVDEGIYRENIDIGRMGIASSGAPGHLVIRGEGATIIESSGNSAFFSSTPLAGDLYLEHLAIRPATGATVDQGVTLNDYTGELHVNDVEFSSLSSRGIELTGASGGLSVVDSVFRDLGGVADATAIDVADFSGFASISGNLIDDVVGTAIQLENSSSQTASVMINDNLVRGEGTLFSTTQSGIVVSLGGESQTDLTLDSNTLESLAVSAIDLDVSGAANLHTRWSRNVASNVDGPVAVQVALENNAIAEIGWWQNTVIDTDGDGLAVSLQGNSALRGVIRENQFTNIGNAAGDDALTIRSGLDSSAELNVAVLENDFLTSAGMGLYLSVDGSSTFQAAIAENSFTKVNIQDDGSAFLAEQATATAEASLLLKLADNDVTLSPGTAYSLRYRGTGSFDLEGNAADAASQIALNNTGQPIVVSGSVGLVSPGSLDAKAPLVLGDRVWKDQNGNGIQDEGETGVGHVRLTLTGTETVSGATVSQTTLTDSEGLYAFVGLMAGDYSVTIELPTAMALGDSDQGLNDALDSDFVLVGGNAAQTDVSLLAALDDSTVDAGLLMTWQNPAEPNRVFRFDVNNDGYVTALDVLLVISDLNGDGSRELTSPPIVPDTPPPFVDVNNDGRVAPLDILLIVNYLNGQAIVDGGEGEGTGWQVDASSADETLATWTPQPTPTHLRDWDVALAETLDASFSTGW